MLQIEVSALVMCGLIHFHTSHSDLSARVYIRACLGVSAEYCGRKLFRLNNVKV